MHLAAELAGYHAAVLDLDPQNVGSFAADCQSMGNDLGSIEVRSLEVLSVSVNV